MKHTTRKVLLITVIVSLVLTLAGCASAIADNTAPKNGIVSVSLYGIETKGVIYTIKEIVRRGDQLDVTFIHQPIEENAATLDYSIFIDDDFQLEERKTALSFGENLIGSTADARLLLPGDNRELTWEQESGGRNGAAYTTTSTFDVSAIANLEDVVLHVYVSFYEKPGQQTAADAILTLPLAGLIK